jgi:hypothetical protein
MQLSLRASLRACTTRVIGRVQRCSVVGGPTGQQHVPRKHLQLHLHQTAAFASIEEAGLSDEILELAKNPAIAALADEIVQLEKELVVRICLYGMDVWYFGHAWVLYSCVHQIMFEPGKLMPSAGKVAKVRQSIADKKTLLAAKLNGSGNHNSPNPEAADDEAEKARKLFIEVCNAHVYNRVGLF